jgi:hypothetical protein
MGLASSALANKAASVATEKAAELAGKFIGGRAGQIAGEALRRYGPELRQQLKRSTRLAQRDPLRAFGYGLAAGLLIIGAWVAVNQATKE